MIQVRAHIRAGKKVRAYTRGFNSKMFGTKGVLLRTDSGHVLSTLGVHNDRLFKAQVLFDPDNPLAGNSKQGTFYKGIGVYKKFKGDPTGYITSKVLVATARNKFDTQRRALINADMAERYHNRKAKKKK